MDKIKKLFLFAIPMSICNFRCHYCYLAQRPSHYEGTQPKLRYSPEQVAYAMRKERIGGTAYINFCADGETLLVKDIDKYARALAEEGNYLEIVSNMTITPMLDKILSWPRDLLKHVEFKCSFHYLELKKQGKLDLFAENVKRVWAAGASANIEITPPDELIPYIDEVKDFSLQNFGALPHLSIARNDSTTSIDYLTNLPIEEYDNAWGPFNSGFWNYKKTIFGRKQTNFCYAGAWSYYVNFATGDARQCYVGQIIGNVFENPDSPLPERAIGKCPIAHCYNGHMLLTLGCIPSATSVGYGDIRDRKREDGKHWLQPELRDFFNTKLMDSNNQFSVTKQKLVILDNKLRDIKTKTNLRAYQALKSIKKTFK